MQEYITMREPSILRAELPKRKAGTAHREVLPFQPRSLLDREVFDPVLKHELQTELHRSIAARARDNAELTVRQVLRDGPIPGLLIKQIEHFDAQVRPEFSH